MVSRPANDRRYLGSRRDCSGRSQNLVDGQSPYRRSFLSSKGMRRVEEKGCDGPGWTLLFVRPSGLETKNRVLCRFLTIMKVILGNGLFKYSAKGKEESFYHTPSPRILYLCRHSATPALRCPTLSGSVRHPHLRRSLFRSSLVTLR